MIIIGVDFHPEFQQIASMETADYPVLSTLKTGPRFVEFETVPGQESNGFLVRRWVAVVNRR